jgi:hypothetical protein
VLDRGGGEGGREWVGSEGRCGEREVWEEGRGVYLSVGTSTSMSRVSRSPFCSRLRNVDLHQKDTHTEKVSDMIFLWCLCMCVVPGVFVGVWSGELLEDLGLCRLLRLYTHRLATPKAKRQD